jgi:sulfopyruvate decarboxylase alpha subunit
MNDGMEKQQTWDSIVIDALKRNDIDLVTFVPDSVLRPLIDATLDDPYFTAFACAREEEAAGIITGAWMAGKRGIIMMQTSGFATLPNVIASLACASQIPLIMVVSERGTLGEFNLGQAMVARTMRPVLDSLGVENHTVSRLDEVDFIFDRSIKQAFATQAPACIMRSPLLTGGKVLKSEKI